MELKKIEESVKDDIERVNTLIIETLSSKVEFLNSINSYLLSNKGKQLRPVLSLVAARACGEVSKKTICCAAVSEMIHTATLLHDDVADDSSVRRGAPTVQTMFSPAASVLSGDYWLSKALSLLTRENDPNILAFFTKAVEELSEGELFQMQKASSLDTTESDYLNIITRKTSSLFVASVASAVYSSGTSEKIIEAMAGYAYNLGIAFQIRDDIFDYMPELNTGKESGADICEKKITLPLILALRGAPESEKLEMIKDIKESDYNDKLMAARTIEFVNRFSGIDLAQKTLSEYCDFAVNSLEIIKESKYKRDLAQIANYVGTRVL
jgi:octaprenyl-diphosphate synthase